MSDRRYVVMREWHEPDGSNFIPRTVHEAEPQAPRDTGLVDQFGVKLYSMETRQPLGFVHFGKPD